MGAVSPIRRMADLLTRRRSSGAHQVNTNGSRLATTTTAWPQQQPRHLPAAQAPPDHHRGAGFMIKDCFSPHPADSKPCSPVLGHHKLQSGSCAIHGLQRLSVTKVSTAVQTLQPGSLAMSPGSPPPPPSGFDTIDEECVSPSSCESPPASMTTSMHMHHMHHIHAAQKNKMRCINPNHFHHHHHHHDPPTLPITLTHNPIEV